MMVKINDEINRILNDEYDDCLSTLELCSRDPSNNKVEYLCDSKIEAYDFDIIKEKFCAEYSIKHIKSVDSLFIKDDKIYLVEFKNQKGSKLKWHDIKLKVHESIIILSEKFKLKRCNYCKIEILVVYSPTNREKSNLENIKKHLKGLITGPDEIQQFDLFQEVYGIKSFKFNNSKFKTYIGDI